MSTLPLVTGAAVITATAAAAHRALLYSPRLSGIVRDYPVWWYGLTRGWRAAVLLVLPVSGALCGLAWELSPQCAAGAIIFLAAATAASRTVRAAARRGR